MTSETPRSIEVTRTRQSDPFEFKVTVQEGGNKTQHRVTLSESTYDQLTQGEVTPEKCIEASFEFLLEREPKESILSSFDVTVISKYFPSFDGEIRNYF